MVGIHTNSTEVYNDIYSKKISTEGFANSGGNVVSGGGSGGGVQVIQGATGAQGPQGIKGNQGDKGDKGDPGGNVLSPTGSGLIGAGTAGSPLSLKIDPSSTSILSITSGGLKIDTSSITGGGTGGALTLGYDALSNILSVDIGGTTKTVSLGSLDDEGVTIGVNAGTLELKNKAGTLISSTPIANIDAQRLAIAGNTLSITNGNSVTLPTPAPITSSLSWTKAGNLSATIDGSVSTVNIPPGTVDKAVGYSAAGSLVYGSVTPPPTTNGFAWNKLTGITTTVDGVISNQAVGTGTVDRILGYDAAGNLIYHNAAGVGSGGGGAATSITTAALNTAFPNPPQPPNATTDSLLTDTGKKLKIQRATSTTGLVLDYFVISI